VTADEDPEDFVALARRAVRMARESSEHSFEAWRELAWARVRLALDGTTDGESWEERMERDVLLPGSVLMLTTAALEARRRGLDPEHLVLDALAAEGPVPPPSAW